MLRFHWVKRNKKELGSQIDRLFFSESFANEGEIPFTLEPKSESPQLVVIFEGARHLDLEQEITLRMSQRNNEKVIRDSYKISDILFKFNSFHYIIC